MTPIHSLNPLVAKWNFRIFTQPDFVNQTGKKFVLHSLIELKFGCVKLIVCFSNFKIWKEW
jgi:hypothetical protein